MLDTKKAQFGGLEAEIFLKTSFEIEVKMLACVNDIVSIFLEVGGPVSLIDVFLISSDGVRHLL